MTALILKYAKCVRISFYQLRVNSFLIHATITKLFDLLTYSIRLVKVSEKVYRRSANSCYLSHFKETKWNFHRNLFNILFSSTSKEAFSVRLSENFALPSIILLALDAKHNMINSCSSWFNHYPLQDHFFASLAARKKIMACDVFVSG